MCSDGWPSRRKVQMQKSQYYSTWQIILVFIVGMWSVKMKRATCRYDCQRPHSLPHQNDGSMGTLFLGLQQLQLISPSGDALRYGHSGFKLIHYWLQQIIMFLLQRSLVVLKCRLFMFTTPTCSTACESKRFWIADWLYQALRGQGWIDFTDCFHPSGNHSFELLWSRVDLSMADTISAVN